MKKVTWAEMEGSEKCFRPGLSPAYMLTSQEGAALFSLPFTSDPSWPGVMKSNRKENTVRLPKTRYLEVLSPTLKLKVQNSNHLIISSS